MVVRFVGCLAVESKKFAGFFFITLTISKICNESRIKISVRLHFTVISRIYPLFISHWRHCTWGKFCLYVQYMWAVYEKTLRIADGGFGKTFYCIRRPQQGLWRRFLKGFLKLGKCFQRSSKNLTLYFLTKKDTKLLVQIVLIQF